MAEEKKKNYGRANKRKGSDAERLYVKEFKKLGFEHCKTSRLGSRLHDNAGIDLICLPFNVQIKAGYASGLNYGKELQYIQDQMTSLFPPSSVEHGLPKILIHRKNREKGRRSRLEYDDLVCMTYVDFVKILKYNLDE